MNRTEYKNNFGREHYERINLVVPKGMKDDVGVRIEDLVIVTEDGCEVLTKYPKDLQIVGND